MQYLITEGETHEYETPIKLIEGFINARKEVEEMQKTSHWSVDWFKIYVFQEDGNSQYCETIEKVRI